MNAHVAGMEMVGEIDSVMIVMFIRSYMIQCLTRRYLKGKQPRGRRKSPTLKRYLKLEIKTLQNAPRCIQIKTAFESKAKTKPGSYAQRRHRRTHYRD